MSNRDALRRLSRRFPKPPEIEKIMDSLRSGSDLAVAITATAIIEASLERLIISRFKRTNASLMGQIFTNRGPLFEFNSKILIADAFGIITSNMAQELHSIKSIRNTFAHAKVPLTFDHELVANEVSSLKMLNAIRRVEKEFEHKLELTPKAWFRLIVEILLSMFDMIAEHEGTAHAIIAEVLESDDLASQEKS